MPKMDGIAMMQELRRRGSRAHVIMLTAYSDFDYARSALQFGADDYLLKPFQDKGSLSRPLSASTARSRRSGLSVSDELPLAKGDKSRYVLEAMEYISEHYAESSINITEDRPAPRRERGALEPCVQEGDEVHRCRISHAVPHTHGDGEASARQPLQAYTRWRAWWGIRTLPISAAPSRSLPGLPRPSTRIDVADVAKALKTFARKLALRPAPRFARHSLSERYFSQGTRPCEK